MKYSGAFIHSKIGRRVFALFVLSALVPLAFLSLFSYRQVTQLLTEQTQRELGEFSSSYGLAAYERALLAESTLDNVIAEMNQAGAASDIERRYARIFRSVMLISSKGERKVVFGKDFEPPRLGNLELEHLRNGESLLESTPIGATFNSLVLVRMTDKSDIDKGRIVAEANPAFLWGGRDQLPYTIDVCVLDARNAPLYCSNSKNQQALLKAAENVAATGARGTLTLTVDVEPYLAAVREVFVASKFGKHYWAVIASRPQSVALAPVSVFRLIFWGSVVVSTLMVMLLSVSQIRRTLNPLESLMAATRRVAKGDFSTPVTVTRKDEFGELAQTFNYMSTRLGRQFNVLETLSQIDRTILSDLHVPSVIEAVLTRLPEIVGADFAAICMLKQDAERNGELHVKPAANVPVATTPLMLSDTARDMLLQNPAGQWQRGAMAAWLCQSFNLGDSDARAFFVLPVMWRNQLCGAVLLGWREQGAALLEDEDVAHVRDFADRVGVVMYSSEREARLFYQARYDSLTSLPNRYLFAERLAQEIAQAKREQRNFVVLFVALDRFKNVSDALGHAAGDALIRDAAQRLRAHVRESDTVCRFGGQEFALLLSGETGANQADTVAQHIIAALSAPFTIDGVESFIAASVGIAVYPNDGGNAADLLRNADTACARASGQSAYVYFAESMNQRAVERASLERDLRRAIEARQFLLFYQPKIDFATMRVVGAEALMRWRHPKRGMVNPGAFIEVAEDTGLIVELGRFALEEGCRQFATWRDEGVTLHHMAINVSSRQFRSSRLLGDVQTQIAAYRLQPGELELEVTESVMVDQVEEVTRLLGELRGCGASIALDDFGTGYSSMRYLETLPLDTLKIDMSFVRPIKANGEGGAIAAAIIALAHSLKKKVVAEGVETEAQAAYLKALGCHVAQGYLYGKALPAQEFASFYRQWTPLQ